MTDVVGLDYRFFQRYRYAIVDAGWREEIPDSWGALPIAPDFLQNDTGRCPLLIDFAVLPQENRNALLVRLEQETAAREDTLLSLALASKKPTRLLLAHLKERLIIRAASGDKPRQFRYFDAGTFIQLPDVLGSVGMSWLLGPIEAVAIPWQGEWREYANPGNRDTWRFRLHEHIDALQNFSVINRVLAQLPDIRNQAEWKEKSRNTRHIVDHAHKAYGLQARDDLIAFATHAWQWHPAFDRHPILQRLLAELAAAAAEDELDYRELTAHLDEADWQKIAHDMQAEMTAEGKMP